LPFTRVIEFLFLISSKYSTAYAVGKKFNKLEDFALLANFLSKNPHH
jgi:hypothetical protein